MTLITVPGGPERRVGDCGGDLPQPEDRLRHPGQLQVDKTGYIECKCTVCTAGSHWPSRMSSAPVTALGACLTARGAWLVTCAATPATATPTTAPATPPQAVCSPGSLSPPPSAAGKYYILTQDLILQDCSKHCLFTFFPG